MRNVLVTGSSRGIGRATAIAFAKKGYNVVINYVKNKAAAFDTASEAAKYSRVIVVQADVSSTADVKRLATECSKNFGVIDTLVNNAGIALHGLLIDHTDDDINRVLGVNLLGMIKTSRAFLPGMLSNGFGRIINLSSIWGRVGASMETLYSTSKAGVIGLTKALSHEVIGMGVTVNAICPGPINTDMLNVLSKDELAAVVERTGANRLGTPAEVAALITFLADENSGFITGEAYGITGEFR